MSDSATGTPHFTIGASNSLLIAGAAVVLVFAVVKAIYKSATVSEDRVESEPEPAMPRPVTFSELRNAVGGEGKELYIAMKDPYGSEITVFDVKGGEDFYGPGGPYHVFAGQNATHGLAKSSMDPAQVTGDLSSLSASEKDTHVGWYNKYSSKYAIVGHLVPDDYEPTAEPVPTDATDSKKDA